MFYQRKALPPAASPFSGKLRRSVTLLFFALVLATGLFIFRDYGTFIDEPYDALTGLVNAKYILQQLSPNLLARFPGLIPTPDLDTFPDRDYGVLFQLPAALIPHVLGFTDSRNIYFTRHLLVFLYFMAGLIAFYQVLRQRFGNSWWPLAGCLFLVLSPRIFAESFYNGKDIVFLSFVAISWFTLNKFRQLLTWKWALLHAVTSAMAFDTRLMGLLLPGLTFLWLAHIGFYSGSGKLRKKLLLLLLVTYLLLFAFFSVLFWPHLWRDTWPSLLEVFQKLNRGGLSFEVLYFGEFIPCNQLPWHYALGWLFITTPVVYSFWFLVGLVFYLKVLLRDKIRFLHTETGQQDTTALLLFALPLAVVIITNAVLYDGWRHLYFIYLPFLYLAILGLQKSWVWFRKNGSNLRIKTGGLVLAGLTLLGVAHTAYLMVVMHPFQQVYFSFLPPAYIEKNFERDYWGLSYRNALEYILRTDNRPELKVAFNFTSGLKALDILKPAERQRIKFVQEPEADYFLSEYRWHPQPYSYPHEVYSIKANGLKIMAVFKLK